MPNEMLADIDRAKIVITNYHAFKLRERMELSKGGRSLLQGRGEDLHMIDSAQLESGDVLDDSFRSMAADEIDRFRREIIERTGDRQQAENITDQALLREVMNTVGKEGRLGDSIRCVVSVSMLTEGWDANTVTHVLGVRAFGTQLLCEQVIGRALRRQSYDLNEDGPNKGLFNVEYADVLGIPFDFTAKPVIAPPQPPRETIQVKAVRPDRDSLEIRFPRVSGYRVELPEERLTAVFNEDSVLELTPDIVGPSITKNQGIIGEGVDLNLIHTRDMRRSTLLFHITQRLLYTKWRDPGEEAKEKKSTMETYWVPGVNNLGSYGRWAFAEFTEVYQIEYDFEKKVEDEFNKMIERQCSETIH